jgi:homoserine kinase type II
LAVHVVLSKDEVRSILSLYHLDPLEDFGGIDEGMINTAYWVRVAGRRYFLRITERKRVRDMVYERELLEHLARAQLPVPRLVENVAKGTFTPWSVRGRFVSLFEYLEGRSLGIFEVRPEHVEQVAKFAASMHVSTQTFERERTNEYDIAALEKKLHRVRSALIQKKLPRTVAEDVDYLAAELERQKTRCVDHLPRGAVHGDLFVDNVRWRDTKISGVIDFEMSCRERLTWDLAVAINAWCWHPSPEQRGGPAGSFDDERMRAFLDGYRSIRELTAAEMEALPDELKLAATRYAIARLADFETRGPERRIYRDYRHFMQRLRVLDQVSETLLVGTGAQ